MLIVKISYLIFATAFSILTQAEEIPTLTIQDLPAFTAAKNGDPKWNKFMWITSTDIKSNIHRLTPLGYQYKKESYETYYNYLPLFVAGIPYNKHIIPGKCYTYPHGTNTMGVNYIKDGNELFYSSEALEFKILYTPPNSVKWVNASFSGDIPKNALAIGNDLKTEETIYVCRHDMNDFAYGYGKVLGKVVNGVCFVPYAGENRFESYEILVKVNNACYRAEGK